MRRRSKWGRTLHFILLKEFVAKCPCSKIINFNKVVQNDFDSKEEKNVLQKR